MHDVIIIGGGPAGAAAAIYSARKKLKTLVITDSFGGQSLISDSIENWIGVKKMTGIEFAKMLEDHVRAQEDIEIKMPEKVVSVKSAQGGPVSSWEITTDKGNVFQCRSIIVVSGGRRRRLNVPGEDKFEGKGVAYCATCDAPIFKNKTVAVIGGGNAGLEAVTDLIPYADKIYLISNKQALTGDPETQENIMKSEKISVIINADVLEIMGDKFVSGLKYLDRADNQTKELAAQGIFVEIGSTPNSEFIKDLVDTDQKGRIIIDHKTGATSRIGIFAAGDVADALYRQNNISAGDAIKAALSAYNYLLNNKM
ncbi:FAD-dependent oxidoreductase [Candidatus Wolfebacteria bacterium]|nr:FAD-dependent oxidoreductase [Candidatus Wolfebacteria bacterium]